VNRIDQWLRRQLSAQRAWTQRSVLGSLGGLSLEACTSGSGTGSSASASTTSSGGGTSSGSTMDSTSTGSTTTASDGIFSDGVTYQLPTITANAATGGYDAVLDVGIA